MPVMPRRKIDITKALFVAERGGFRPTAFALGPWTPEHLHGGPVAGLIATNLLRHFTAPRVPVMPRRKIDITKALFVAERGGFRPTAFALGPWTPEHLHGGPVAGLIAREAQRCEPDDRLRVARLTIELIRPVSLAPISVEARLIRPGRKVQLVEVIARQDGVEVALGRALRIRTADIHLPKAARHVEIPFAPPESGVLMASKGLPRTFHSEGAELRFVEGAYESPGPARVWVRLRVPVQLVREPRRLKRSLDT